MILNAAPGFKVAIATDTAYSAEVNFNDTVRFTGFTTMSGNFFHSGAGATFCGGPLHCCDDIVAFYGQTSDVNLKENVTILDSSLEKLMGIRGTEYDWKEGHKSYTGHDIGVIAQDVENKITNLSFVKDVLVELVWDPQWNQDMMTEEAKLKLGML